MNSISKQIELLLLEHDCVIIPGFGGFIANDASARYAESDDMAFLPPYRTIGFNQALQSNDGLLAQSYMQVYDASYPDAYKQMLMDIDCVKLELKLNGEYKFDGIGTIKQSLSENITFIPFDAGVLTPELYGLYSFDIKPISVLEEERNRSNSIADVSAIGFNKVSSNNIETKLNTDNNTKESHVVIKVNRRLIDFAISAAAAILLFFVFSYPALHNNNVNENTCVASAFVATDVNTNNSKNTTVESENAVKAIATEDDAKVSKVSESIDSDDYLFHYNSSKKYVIVLASHVIEENAISLCKKMAKKEGLTEARLYKGDVNKVFYSAFASHDEAKNALTELNGKSDRFAHSWVLELD